MIKPDNCICGAETKEVYGHKMICPYRNPKLRKKKESRCMKS